MSARKKTTILYIIILFCFLPFIAIAATIEKSTSAKMTSAAPSTLAADTLAKQLGWVASPENNCGGYYLEEPLIYPVSVNKNSSVEITSDQTLFSQHGTSILEGKVMATRYGEQMTANKAYLYRNPTTGKLSVMEMIGDVNLREPNTLIVGKKGRYNFETRTKSLNDVLYRTSFPSNKQPVTQADMQKERKITSLSVWGKASEVSQTEPRIYELSQASYTTCPPIHPSWQVRASHIVLNKNTGRGYATNVRLLVKSVPVFYTPYINFPIDNRRKTGFLWPTYGGSSKSGPSFYAPFYWNMAPNYDMTITPSLLLKRGFMFGDSFRYLTETGSGKFNVSVLPSDKLFTDFQRAAADNPLTAQPSTANTPDQTNAEINRLLNDSTTRKALFWRDDSQFNPIGPVTLISIMLAMTII